MMIKIYLSKALLVRGTLPHFTVQARALLIRRTLVNDNVDVYRLGLALLMRRTSALHGYYTSCL